MTNSTIEVQLRSIEALSESITTSYINHGITPELLRTINRIGERIWLVKETLNQLEPKLKTSDQKEENQEDQQEPRNSPLPNDQTSPAKEHKQKTPNPNKQYIITYPIGTSLCDDNTVNNANLASDILDAIIAGDHITFPNYFELTVLEH